MDQRTSKNDNESFKSERLRPLERLAWYLSEDRPGWIDQPSVQFILADWTSEELANMTSEDQKKLARIIERLALQQIQRNIATTQELLYDTILQSIEEQTRREVRAKLEREGLETVKVKVAGSMISPPHEIVRLETKKEKQQRLENQLAKDMVDMVKKAGSAGTSLPADETILPPLIFALV